MIGQSLSTAWVEHQQGDFAVYGGEGNPTVGAYVYRLDVPGYHRDAVGATKQPITGVYQPYFKDFGAASKEKYLRAMHMDLRYNPTLTSVSIDIHDLDGPVATNLTVDEIP